MWLSRDLPEGEVRKGFFTSVEKNPRLGSNLRLRIEKTVSQEPDYSDSGVLQATSLNTLR
jgi:hypothetical protein